MNALSESDRQGWIEAIAKCVARLQSPNTIFSPVSSSSNVIPAAENYAQANAMLQDALDHVEETEEIERSSSGNNLNVNYNRLSKSSRSAQSSPGGSPHASSRLNTGNTVSALDLAQSKQ